MSKHYSRTEPNHIVCVKYPIHS